MFIKITDMNILKNWKYYGQQINYLVHALAEFTSLQLNNCVYNGIGKIHS